MTYEPHPQAGQPVPPQRGLPGWAIGLIVTLAALLILMLAAGIWGITALGRAISEAGPARPLATPEAPLVPAPDHSGEDAELAAQAAEDSQYIIDTADRYRAARTDGTITALVPGGDTVDPDYITAFLYVLTDLRSAVRFTPATPDNAGQLREYAEEVAELEQRFLHGEDLDVEVTITREDGSVFESDGKYRTITPKEGTP